MRGLFLRWNTQHLVINIELRVHGCIERSYGDRERLLPDNVGLGFVRLTQHLLKLLDLLQLVGHAIGMIPRTQTLSTKYTVTVLFQLFVLPEQ